MIDSESESDLLSAFGSLSVADNHSRKVVPKSMDPQQLQQIVESAVASALTVQATQFNAKIRDLSDRLEWAATISAPQVKSFDPVQIDRSVADSTVRRVESDEERSE